MSKLNLIIRIVLHISSPHIFLKGPPPASWWNSECDLATQERKRQLFQLLGSTLAFRIIPFLSKRRPQPKEFLIKLKEKPGISTDAKAFNLKLRLINSGKSSKVLRNGILTPSTIIWTLYRKVT